MGKTSGILEEIVGRVDINQPESFFFSQTNAMNAARQGEMHASVLPRVYVIAQNETVRAAISKLISINGFRVYEFSGPEQLARDMPEDGIVFVHESGSLGAARICATLAESDLWFPVVGFGTEIDAQRVLEGMKAGAIDYLVGQITSDRLDSLLAECVERGKIIRDRRNRRDSARQRLNKLSKREREVLDLVASGLSSKEAAQCLALSHRTVEIHRLKILAKLGAASAAHAVSIASQAGL